MPPLTQQEILYLNSVSPMMRQQYLDAKAAQMGGQQQQMQQQPQQTQQQPAQGQGGLLQSMLGGSGGQQATQQVAKPSGQNLFQSLFGGGSSAAATEGASSLSGLTGAAGSGSEVAASGFGEGLGSMMGGGSEVAGSGFGEGLGSMMAGSGEGMGATSMMSAALPYLGGAAALYGGYRLGDQMLRSGEKAPMQGALNGATMGAGIGTMILPGVGTAIGAAGGGLLGGVLGATRHVSPETRQRRRAQSASRDVEGGDYWYNQSVEGNPERKKMQADAMAAKAADYIGLDENGTWVNNKFANSRSEADLKPEDIWQSSQMLQTFGNDWNSGKYTDKRREVAQALLDNNLIDERKGGIYFQKGQENRAREIADQVIGGAVVPMSKPTTDLSGFKGVLKNGVEQGIASSPVIPMNKNQGLKAGDAGYDWNYARAQKKGQARW